MRRVLPALLLVSSAPLLAQGVPAALIASFSGQSAGVAKQSPGLFYSATVSPATSQGAGFMMLFDAASPPPDGSVTPLACFYVSTGPRTSSMGSGAAPLSMSTGISWAFSSAPNCQTKTAAPVNFITVTYR